MGRKLILETTFLVDLDRELLRGVAGPAQAALERHRDDSLHITFTVAGELACGPELGSRGEWESLVGRFPVLPATPDVCWEYGKAWRYLRDNGVLIGANDLWIAATAVAAEMPVVTRNLADFRRVPGVSVLEY